jgi:hypothetical protein
MLQFRGEVLAALLPWLSQAIRGPQLDRCRSNTMEIALALEMYASDSGGNYPPDLATLTRSGHLKAIPTCPAAGFDNYSETYHVSASPECFSFGCAGRHHGEPSRERTYPAWWDRVHCAPQGFPWRDSEVQACCMDVDLDE